MPDGGEPRHVCYTGLCLRSFAPLRMTGWVVLAGSQKRRRSAAVHIRSSMMERSCGQGARRAAPLQSQDRIEVRLISCRDGAQQRCARTCSRFGGGSEAGRCELGFGGGGVGRGRELGDADDDFALFGALQLFAGDAFDFVGIGFQGFDLAAELDVFGVEAVDVFADALDFELSVAHGDEAMCAENVVNDEGENEEAEDSTAVLLEEIADLSFYGLVHGARTHFVASSVSFADAFALSASM